MKVRLDANHNDVVGWYRDLGCSVADCAAGGWRTPGCPDLFVGCCSVTDPIEIKTEEGKLSGSQETFLLTWRGSKVALVRSMDDVVRHVQEMRSRAIKGAA